MNLPKNGLISFWYLLWNKNWINLFWGHSKFDVLFQVIPLALCSLYRLIRGAFVNLINEFSTQHAYISLRTIICCSFDLLARNFTLWNFLPCSFFIFLFIWIKIDADKACCSWLWQRSMPVVDAWRLAFVVLVALFFGQNWSRPTVSFPFIVDSCGFAAVKLTFVRTFLILSRCWLLTKTYN